MKRFFRRYIRFVVVVVVGTLCYPQIAEAADKYHEMADQYWSQAEELYKQERYLDAAKLYEKSIEAEKTSPKARLEDLALKFNMAGYCYDEVSQYDKALVYYEQALDLNRELGKEIEIATNLNNIGAVYDEWGQYDKALDFYNQALEIDRCTHTGDSLLNTLIVNLDATHLGGHLGRVNHDRFTDLYLAGGQRAGDDSAKPLHGEHTVHWKPE